jgi:hypothetical protein
MSKDLPWCQIYDLDGTLAIRGDRGPYDWDRVGDDTVNEAVAYVNYLSANSLDTVLIVSGRSDVCYEHTKRWLGSHRINWDTLYMRKEDDNRDDVIVKEKTYNEHIKGKYQVRFVVDDRPKVCRMWRSLGLPVFQVGDPDVEF